MPVRYETHRLGQRLVRETHDTPQKHRRAPLLNDGLAHHALHALLVTARVANRYSEEEVANAAKGIDQHAILAKHRERHEIVVWDKRSAINGVPAKKVLRELQHDYDEIYLVVVDGDVTIFQPHAPDVEGFEVLTGDTVERHALRHVERLARHHAADEIVRTIADTLEVPGPPDTSHFTDFADSEVPGLD